MKGNRAVLTVIAATVTAMGTALTFAPAASAETHPNTTMNLTDWPAENTGGLIIRDKYGNDLGSGIGEGQNFEFLECGPDGSGLIKVKQLTRGTGGGWGDLYEGYVKAEWTMLSQGGFDNYYEACQDI